MRRRSGGYVLDGHAGALRTGVSMRCGEIRTGGGSYQLDVTDFHRCGVVARVGQRPVVRLHPDGCQVPGPGGPARWSPHRGGGVLVRDGGRIEVRQAGRPGAPVRVEVTGPWPELELVALTACFAVLTRRRKRILTIMAIVGATGHG
ncbi:hypothetical protein ABGB07_00440 [Micromonosporaceae bacterium B7E4]